MPDDIDAASLRTVDVHFHVGLRGDKYPEWGHITDKMRSKRPDYDVFLLFAGLKRGDDSDEKIIESTLATINESKVDSVVCLALDHVYDEDGTPRKEKSDIWVANAFLKSWKMTLCHAFVELGIQ